MQCAELSEKLAEDMASEGLRGKTLTLKLKETNFEVRTRNITLTRHISSREDITREALKLLRAEMPITIRLMVILWLHPYTSILPLVTLACCTDEHMEQRTT